MACHTRSQAAANALPAVRKRVPSKMLREEDVLAPSSPAKRRKRSSKARTPMPEDVSDGESDDEVTTPLGVDNSFLESNYELSTTAFLDGTAISNRFRAVRPLQFDFDEYL